MIEQDDFLDAHMEDRRAARVRAVQFMRRLNSLADCHRRAGLPFTIYDLHDIVDAASGD